MVDSPAALTIRQAPDGFAIALAEGRQQIYIQNRRLRDGFSFQGHDVSRSNIIYLVIGALVVAVVVLGYQLYQRQNQGVQINIGPGGASIETK